MSAPGPLPATGGFNPVGHLSAAALLFGLSSLGVALPSLLRRAARKADPRRTAALDDAVRLGTCFGFGTILSTAVIHMLPSAISRLDGPAAGGGGPTENDSPRAYQLLLVSLLAMHFLDWAVSALAPAVAARQANSQAAAAALHLLHHSHSSGDVLAPFEADSHEGGDGSLREGLLVGGELAEAARHGSDEPADGLLAAAASDPECQSPNYQPWQQQQQQQQHQKGVPRRGVPTDGALQDELGCLSRTSLASDGGDGTSALTAQAREQSMIASVVGLALLELGVSVHSTLIGLGLGVARGPTFHTLLLALCIHQFFEGLALGGVAEDVGLSRELCLALGGIFAASTPLGVVAGVLLRIAAGGSGTRAVALEGSMEAVGTGILLYVGLVQLLTPHMSRAQWLRAAGPGMKAAAFVSLWAGAAAMTVLGHWI